MWHGQSVSAIFVVMDSGLAGLRPRARNDSGAHSKFFAGGQSRE